MQRSSTSVTKGLYFPSTGLRVARWGVQQSRLRVWGLSGKDLKPMLPWKGTESPWSAKDPPRSWLISQKSGPDSLAMGGEEGPKLRHFSGGGSCIERHVLLNRNRRVVSQTNHINAWTYPERMNFSDPDSTPGILHSFSPCLYHVFT